MEFVRGTALEGDMWELMPDSGCVSRMLKEKVRLSNGKNSMFDEMNALHRQNGAAMSRYNSHVETTSLTLTVNEAHCSTVYRPC